MVAPLKSGKKSVNLASGEVRVSRIRRDPPAKPIAEKISERDASDNDRRDAIIGIAAFALALFVIIFAVMSYGGWSMSDYSVRM